MTKTRTSKLLLLLAFSFSGCGGNEGVLRSGKETPAPPPVETKQKDPFESDLAEIRDAKFAYLYVVRRRDGGILNSEDKTFVKQHTVDANRRVLSDGGKAVIVGSNYSVTVAGAEALKARFDVADLSPSPAQ